MKLNNIKKVIFLTGTRADYGKFKSLMKVVESAEELELFIFATGMHMSAKYGKTVDEILKEGYQNVFQFINHDTVEHMDRTLAKTIDGFSHYVAEIVPDLIVVHGDRPEALAGAIVGSLNNILVAHVEGGEVSGTIDELIRHAVTKMSHLHFVANEEAMNRLIQLGEIPENIYKIGSPDFDLMNPSLLPILDLVKSHYEIDFDEYALAMYHPVTTENKYAAEHAKYFVNALIASDLNYVVIFPNNDLGSSEILREYTRIHGLSNFKIFPSVRFESFLTLLNHALFIIGNSSAGIREAPFYGTPTIDIGSRQKNRAKSSLIAHAENDMASILSAIKHLIDNSYESDSSQINREEFHFGDGRSDKRFLEIVQRPSFWDASCQKQFKEIRH